MKTPKIIFFILLHILLGHLSHRIPMVSTVHAYSVLALGVFWAIRGNIPNLAYTAAYIVGGEVFWRMTNARIFWEYGKYSISFIFMILLITRGFKKPFFPIIYFCCLLPSVVFLPTMLFNADAISQNQISGNLSGPLLLTISTLFFSKARLTPPQIRRLLFYLVFPIISALSIVGYMTYTAEDLYFTAASNAATSGGFGPNQVSSILGLGALAAYLLFFIGKPGIVQKVLLFLIAILMATQSALTFSRSGVYTAVCASIAATFYLVTNRKNIMKIIFTMLVIVLIANFFVWPRLVRFTGGAIEKRFKETSMTNRESLFNQDIQLFMNNPLFGVGPGQSAKRRTQDLAGAAGHTEFSRLLAEHGMFGLLALILLGSMTFQILTRKKILLGQAISVASLTWAFLFMAVNAMRIAAPSFMFGLAALTLFEFNPQMMRRPPPPPAVIPEPKT